VGGIQDQIVHGRSGVLVDDPADLPSFGRALAELLADRPRARRMGRAARARVHDRYLPVRQFEADVALISRLTQS
jgi:trehalose synthase